MQIDQTEIDPNGVFAADQYRWQIEYDELNRATRVIDNLSNVTLGQYDSRHNLIELTDSLNNISTYIFDGQDRLIQTIDWMIRNNDSGYFDGVEYPGKTNENETETPNGA